MALSANLEKAGHPAKRISTTATVKLEMVGGGPKITTIDLKTEADGILFYERVCFYGLRALNREHF